MDILSGADDDGAEGGALEVRRHTGAGQDEQQERNAPGDQRETQAACRVHGLLLLGLAGWRKSVGSRACLDGGMAARIGRPQRTNGGES